MTVLLRTKAPKAGETAAQLAAVAGAEESAGEGLKSQGWKVYQTWVFSESSRLATLFRSFLVSQKKTGCVL